MLIGVFAEPTGDWRIVGFAEGGEEGASAGAYLPQATVCSFFECKLGWLLIILVGCKLKFSLSRAPFSELTSPSSRISNGTQKFTEVPNRSISS